MIKGNDQKEYAEEHMKTSGHVNYQKYASLVLNLIGRWGSVIDLGCADARMLKLFDEHTEIESFGVDNNLYYWEIGPNKEYANRVKQVDLNSPEDLGRQFDCVLCLDVLEHLDPKKELDYIKYFEDLSGRWLVIGACISDHIKEDEIAEVGWGGDDTHINVRGRGYWYAKIPSLTNFKVHKSATKIFNDLMGYGHGNEYVVFRKEN